MVSFGDNTSIGAHSLVLDHIPANCLAAGTPAKIIKNYDMDLMIISPNMDPNKKSCQMLEKGDDYIVWKSGFGCTLKKFDYAPMPRYLDFSIKSAEEYESFSFDDLNDEDRCYGIRQDIISGDGFTTFPSFSEALKQ